MVFPVRNGGVFLAIARAMLYNCIEVIRMADSTKQSATKPKDAEVTREQTGHGGLLAFERSAVDA